jgi:hypothetical protein
MPKDEMASIPYRASSIATLSNNFEKIPESQEQLLKTRADLARVDKLKEALKFLLKKNLTRRRKLFS